MVEKANSAYTDHILNIGKNGNNLDIFTCLSPCIIGYGEIGFKLSKIKNWEKSKYSSWVKMYSSKEYQKVAKENIKHLDTLFLPNNKNDTIKLKKYFKMSTILERNFWQCFVNKKI
jgi:thiaminase/transcriptional activator TenA